MHFNGAHHLLCWCVGIFTILQIYFTEIIDKNFECKIVEI